MRIVRPEKPEDAAAIYEVNRQAFDGREAEAGLVESIRKSDSFIPEQSLVAEEEGEIVGHILFSPIHIETEKGQVPALSLAPMSVLPNYQNQSIGTELVRRGLEVCRHLSHQIVIVLGHPDYYPRFGFSADKAKDLESPFGDPGDAWMALEMSPGALDGVRGRVIYPPVFSNV